MRKIDFDESWMPEPNSGCWLWIGSIGNSGYGGMITSEYGRLRPHCVSWIKNKGLIPKGMCVCHHCDTRPCVNPKHLFLGSRTDNAADATRKHRHARGEKHGHSNLTSDQVRTIKTLPGTICQISKDLGLPYSQVYKIKKGHRWAHIT